VTDFVRPCFAGLVRSLPSLELADLLLSLWFTWDHDRVRGRARHYTSYRECVLWDETEAEDTDEHSFTNRIEADWRQFVVEGGPVWTREMAEMAKEPLRVFSGRSEEGRVWNASFIKADDSNQ
jgi:hypothetical protein